MPSFFGIQVCIDLPHFASCSARHFIVVTTIIAPALQFSQADTIVALQPLLLGPLQASCVCVALWSEKVADVIGLIGASFGSLIVWNSESWWSAFLRI